MNAKDFYKTFRANTMAIYEEHISGRKQSAVVAYQHAAEDLTHLRVEIALGKLSNGNLDNDLALAKRMNEELNNAYQQLFEQTARRGAALK